MKALILSFFAIILGYSLFFNEKKEAQPTLSEKSNDVAVKPVNPQASDTLVIYEDYRAFIM